MLKCLLVAGTLVCQPIAQQTFPWHLYAPIGKGYRIVDSYSDPNDCFEDAKQIRGSFCDRDPLMT